MCAAVVILLLVLATLAVVGVVEWVRRAPVRAASERETEANVALFRSMNADRKDPFASRHYAQLALYLESRSRFVQESSR